MLQTSSMQMSSRYLIVRTIKHSNGNVAAKSSQFSDQTALLQIHDGYEALTGAMWPVYL